MKLQEVRIRDIRVTDELERLAMAYSPRLRKMLTLARKQIKERAGIPHAEFWKDMEAK